MSFKLQVNSYFPVYRAARLKWTGARQKGRYFSTPGNP